MMAQAVCLCQMIIYEDQYDPFWVLTKEDKKKEY